MEPAKTWPQASAAIEALAALTGNDTQQCRTAMSAMLGCVEAALTYKIQYSCSESLGIFYSLYNQQLRYKAHALREA